MWLVVKSLCVARSGGELEDDVVIVLPSTKSTTQYYKVLLRTIKWYSVLQSILQCYKVLLRTSPYCEVLLRLIVAAHETSRTMRGATRVTVQHLVRPDMTCPVHCAEHQESPSRKMILMIDALRVQYEMSSTMCGASGLT